MTEGRRWRGKRDRAILCLRALGWTLRGIGDVFDLPPSRISAIVAAESGRLESVPTSEPPRGYLMRTGRIVKKPILEDE